MEALEEDFEDDFNVVLGKRGDIQKVVRAMDDYLVNVGDGKFVGNDSDEPVMVCLGFGMAVVAAPAGNLRRSEMFITDAERTRGKKVVTVFFLQNRRFRFGPFFFFWGMIVGSESAFSGEDDPAVGIGIGNVFGHKSRNMEHVTCNRKTKTVVTVR